MSATVTKSIRKIFIDRSQSGKLSPRKKENGSVMQIHTVNISINHIGAPSIGFCFCLVISRPIRVQAAIAAATGMLATEYPNCACGLPRLTLVHMMAPIQGCFSVHTRPPARMAKSKRSLMPQAPALPNGRTD